MFVYNNKSDIVDDYIEEDTSAYTWYRRMLHCSIFKFS